MTKGHKKSLELMGMLIILPGDGSVGISICQNSPHCNLYLCSLFVCQLHFNKAVT